MSCLNWFTWCEGESESILREWSEGAAVGIRFGWWGGKLRRKVSRTLWQCNDADEEKQLLSRKKCLCLFDSGCNVGASGQIICQAAESFSTVSVDEDGEGACSAFSASMTTLMTSLFLLVSCSVSRCLLRPMMSASGPLLCKQTHLLLRSGRPQRCY